MIKLLLRVTAPVVLLVLVALVGCTATTGLLRATSFSEQNPADPAEDGQFQQQSAEALPIIHHASVQPTKVLPGDTMMVTAEVSDPSGIKSVTADMGGIEIISLSLIEGSIYHGTWQGQWLVHDTSVRDYVTTIVATNSIGKSSATEVLWRDAVTYERYHKEVYATTNTTSTTWVTVLTLDFSPNVDGDFLIIGRADIGQSTDISEQTAARTLGYILGTATGGSDTTLVDTVLDEASGYYIGWILEMTSGINNGESQEVTAFASNTLTTASFGQANQSGDTYKLYKVIHEILFYPNATDEAGSFGAHDVLSLDDAKTYYFSFDFKSVGGTNDASITNYGITAIAVAGYGGFTGHDAVEAETSGAGGWKTRATASITGPGDYWVIGTIEIRGTSTTKVMEVQILEDDSTSWGVLSRIPTSTSQWHLFTVWRKVTVSAGAHNFKLQWQGAGGGTVYIRRARITAVDIATLSDTASEYTEDETEGLTTSTTWVTKLTHKFLPSTSWNGLRLGYALMSSQDKVNYVYGALYEDGVEIGTSNMMPNNKTTDYMPLWTAFHRFHSSSSNWTIELKYRAATGGTAYSKANRILIIRLDNLNPFGDAGHTGYLDVFDEASEDTVYIQGSYYYYNPGPPIDYTALTVAYYDGNGDIVAADSTADADVNGVIESQLYFPAYIATAEVGTWHAVVYMDAIASPPSTYTPNDSNSIRETAFTVTAAAIPEFPTVMAAIGVAGLCFGIYYWMRKRKLAYVKA